MNHETSVTTTDPARTKVTKALRDAVDAAAKQHLLDVGIPLAQRCAHQVAKLYGQMALNNENGDVRPSVAWVAARLGYTRRQVQRANKMLEEAGFWQAVGRYARRVIRRITLVVEGAAPAKPAAPAPAESAPTKGDMASPSKATWSRRTIAAPYSLKPNDKPTPTPPPFVPSTATGSNAEVRAASKAAVAAVIAAARWKKVAANG